jgi:acetate kinase
MGTRSGDIDPAVPLHMMSTLQLSAKEMDTGVCVCVCSVC